MMTDQEERRFEALLEEALGLEGGRRLRFLAGVEDREIREELESAIADAEESATKLLEPAGGSIARQFKDQGSPALEDVGPFELLRELGSGGMGTVYLAQHRHKGKWYGQVAVKVMRNRDPELAERLQAERRFLGGLSHPGIAQIRDGGETGEGFPYIAMEYVDGSPIHAWCDDKQLTTGQRLELFIEVCAAVQAAHQALVVHRDIKPSNVFVNASGRVKLLDFGIAKSLDPDRLSEVTHRDSRMFTEQFASPEQIAGERVDTRSDVYSLGVLLYRLLSRSNPYPASLYDWLDALREGETKTLEEGLEASIQTAGEEEVLTAFGATKKTALVQELTGELEWIVSKAMRSERGERYASASDLASDVRRYLNKEPIAAFPTTRLYEFRKFVERRRGLALAIGGVAGSTLLALLLALGWGVSSRKQAEQIANERDIAQETVRFLESVFAVVDPVKVDAEELDLREFLRLSGEELLADRGGQDPEVRRALAGALGGVHRNVGMFSSAEDLLEVAVGVEPEGHSEVACRAEVDLAVLRIQTGELEAASRLVEHLEAVRPQWHRTALVAGLLGIEQGSPGLAVEKLQAGVSGLGESEDGKARLLAALGEALDRAGRPTEAKRVLEEARGLYRRDLSDSHPLVVEAVNNLAVVYGKTGDTEGAARLLKMTLAARRERLGEEHPDTAEALNNLGMVQLVGGDLRGAERAFSQATEVARALGAGGEPRLAVYLSNLGWAIADGPEGEERRSEAAEHFEEARELRAAIYGREDVRLAATLVGLGEASCGPQVGLAQGEAAFQDALGVLGSTDSTHWRIGEARSRLGKCLMENDQRDRGLVELKEGLRHLEAHRGPDHRKTLEARERLELFQG